ncbi:hypothetical protein ACTXMB_15000 [Arthrobacter rhombi]|uniref:hypothetical protein n=1 Tax=Arthrobacter rhombi TaxID=71253 RepID=UPI003FD4AFE4
MHEEKLRQAAEAVRVAALEVEAVDHDAESGTTTRAVRWADFRQSLDKYCEIHGSSAR